MSRSPYLVRICLLGVVASLPAFGAAADASTPKPANNNTAIAWSVNANTISDPTQAWLNGGPQNNTASGLVVTNYYYMITDTSGGTLLSTDPLWCRQTQAILVNGKGVLYGVPPGAPGCSHPDAITLGLPGITPPGSNPVQLAPFSPSFNGIYKLWLMPQSALDAACDPMAASQTSCTNGVFGFDRSQSKTDNFKISCSARTSLEAAEATVSNGGSGYAVGDLGTVGNGGAVYEVAAVSNGAVTKFLILNAGSGYSSGMLSTLATSGLGTGFTISFTTSPTGGQFCPTSGTLPTVISGIKFNDANQNQMLDNNEPGIPNWTINVSVNGGAATALTTDGGGNWSIPIAPGATFTACEVPQATWYQSYPPANLPMGTGPGGSSVLLQSSVYCWTGTVPASDTTGYNFGNYQFKDVTVSKTVTPTFTRTYNWSISKSVLPTTINVPSGTNAQPGYTVAVTQTGVTDTSFAVNGSITVSNPNLLQAFPGVNVADAPGNGGMCTITGGSNNGTNESIPAGMTVTFNYNCTFTSATAATTGTNTATATWTVGTVDSMTSAQYQVGYGFAGGPTTRVNQSVTVTDNFNNTGAATIGTALATDPPAAAYSNNFTYSRQIPGVASTCTSYPNTAALTTGSPATTLGTSGASVKVCVGVDLQVTKTAAAGFTTKVAKSVDKPKVQQSGGTITLNYTVTVTESAWTVSGIISVKNPNDWEAITANVADALTDIGGVCAVTGGSGASIAASTTSMFNYSCSFAAVPGSGSGSNTATATWNNATFYTPHGSASNVPVPYAFDTLTVTDCWILQGSATTCPPPTATLGTISTPAATTTYTYSHTVNNAAPGTCQEYDNTATATDTSLLVPTVVGSASASAVQCNTNTGALTIGFWKNSNGQGIINNFCAGTSGTSLYTFLTGFNPFKDLASGSTCKQEATYVSSIMGAATCTSSTSTCNAMLRAQMLSTALDVYFSDPALGGYKIGAYNGFGATGPAIGGVAIDLSKICPVGTTCTVSSNEDARPEYGVCTASGTPAPACSSSLLGATVSEMLNYANNTLTSYNGSPVASPNVGAGWYKQTKTIQVIAKDAFDDINNIVAGIAPAGAFVTAPNF